MTRLAIIVAGALMAIITAPIVATEQNVLV
jgi:hypothetical protein